MPMTTKSLGSGPRSESSDVADITRRALLYLLVGNLCILVVMLLVFLLGR